MGQYQFIVALLLSSLTSLFIFFRFFEAYFYKKKSDTDTLVVTEPLVFKIPLVITSALVLFLGLSYNYWFQYIMNIIPVGLR